ncbi:hypothetical protein, partial [Caldilinea sp.]|uniref:hypothetical protein n=1 Tax=Caldilinea sp. TaxID=2293560 RepID=UPI002BDC856E|nr:hypothetical protein [Caldilinea sp.]
GRLDGGTGDFARASLAGVNAGYVEAAQTVYHLRSRAPGFADDAAVWEALLTRDDVDCPSGAFPCAAVAALWPAAG